MIRVDDTSRGSNGWLQWWRDAVIYQVYVRSFADCDGDGDRRPARHPVAAAATCSELGVDAHLADARSTPRRMADGGYDVADYRDVDPVFGTLADFDALIADAHAPRACGSSSTSSPTTRSDQHPWFQAALAAGPGSPERARYLFRDGRGRRRRAAQQLARACSAAPPGPGSEPDGARQWYLHLFAPEQPDLELAQPRGRASEFDAILRFWLDRGVDGFRIDVAHGLAKDPGLPRPRRDDAEPTLDPRRRSTRCWDQRRGARRLPAAGAQVLGRLRPATACSSARRGCDDPERLARYVRPDELHQAFNFDFLRAPWDADVAAQVIDESALADRRRSAPPPPGCCPTTTSSATSPATADGEHRGSGRAARPAALLMLALPGSAYIYQGEELGLPEVARPARRASSRTRSSPHRRRATGPRRLPGADPVVRDATAVRLRPRRRGPGCRSRSHWRALSAQAESEDAASMLVLYRNALALRQFVRGDAGADLARDAGEEVLAFRRGDGFACLVNFGDAPMSLPEGAEVLLASDPAYVAGAPLTVDTAVWVRL